MVNGETDFFRDAEGKIDSKRLSPYGKGQLASFDGVESPFKDGVFTVKGNKLVDKQGKTVQVIDNDRMVNKIIFKII